jgi:hypothetical protein
LFYYPKLAPTRKFDRAMTSARSKIEFAAAHEEMTPWIGADEAALMIDQPGTA